jgi:hypothetical protein
MQAAPPGGILRRMTMKRTPRPRDPVQLGKLMVDIMTGQVPDAVDDGKDTGASALGREGGLKGGAARASKLTPEQRASIASKAAKSRWAKKA